MTGSPKVTSKRATLREIGAWPVFSVFFLEAFVLGNWIPRIPDVKADFGFSASQLGLALFALSFGTLFAFLTAGWIVGRLGLRRANMVALSFWAIFVGLAPAMPSGLVLGMFGVWSACGAVALYFGYFGIDIPFPVQITIAVSGLYLYCVGAVLQWMGRAV